MYWRGLMIHELKIIPEYYNDIISGRKTFEVRFNDRNYQVGDVLVLREYENGEYTGRAIERKVIYILDETSGYVLKDHVIMSLGRE